MGSAVGGSEARRLMIMASVVVVIALIFVLGFLRSCGVRDPYAGYVVIYSNLELKDSADVVAQLKEQKMLYQIRDGGTAIAVPKDKADEARLTLAQKNLPLGGSVGWEIFNESKLGTTDFDRRIQFVRAISGELARTIKKIDAVQDARVQIVIPQTTLFEVTQVPVTASVLLQLKTGRRLSREQIHGIVRLVSHSVENLRPENVSIVDVFGNILTGPDAVTPEATEISPIFPKERENRFDVIKQKEAREPERAVPTKEIEVVVSERILPRTNEEKALAALKAKEEMENDLSSKAQSIVNRFYPPNSILVKVNLEIEDYQAPAAKKKKLSNAKKTETELLNESIKKMTVIILVDNRFNLTGQLKKTTTDMVASALPYHSLRGDKIVIRQVPFHYATAVKSESVASNKPSSESAAAKSQAHDWAGSFAAVFSLVSRANPIVLWCAGGFFVVLLLNRLFRRPKIRKAQAPNVKKPVPLQKKEAAPSAVDQVRSAVSRSPEKVAKLIEKWLTEEEENKQ